MGRVSRSTRAAQRTTPTTDVSQTAAAELLDLPLKLHRRDGIPTLVVFDEFQDLLSAGPSLDGLLRSHVQYHGEAAVYVYAGTSVAVARNHKLTFSPSILRPLIWRNAKA